MALIKMEPPQIAAIWEKIAPEVARTAIPTADDSDRGLNAVLAKLLSGEMRLWIIADSCEADLTKSVLYGHAITMPVQDWATGAVNLLIYSLFSWQLIPDQIAMDGIKTLMDYGKSLGCRKLIAYTVEPRIEQLAALCGLSVTCKFIEGNIS